MPRKAIISYSREDELYAAELEKFLRILGLEVFRDRHLKTGVAWHPEIQEQLESSDIGVSLLTPSYFEPDPSGLNHCTDEARFMARRAQRDPRFLYLPIHLATCLINSPGAPVAELFDLQISPSFRESVFAEYGVGLEPFRSFCVSEFVPDLEARLAELDHDPPPPPDSGAAAVESDFREVRGNVVSLSEWKAKHWRSELSGIAKVFGPLIGLFAVTVLLTGITLEALWFMALALAVTMSVSMFVWLILPRIERIAGSFLQASLSRLWWVSAEAGLDDRLAWWRLRRFRRSLEDEERPVITVLHEARSSELLRLLLRERLRERIEQLAMRVPEHQLWVTLIQTEPRGIPRQELYRALSEHRRRLARSEARQVPEALDDWVLRELRASGWRDWCNSSQQAVDLEPGIDVYGPARGVRVLPFHQGRWLENARPFTEAREHWVGAMRVFVHLARTVRWTFGWVESDGQPILVVGNVEIESIEIDWMGDVTLLENGQIEAIEWKKALVNRDLSEDQSSDSAQDPTLAELVERVYHGAQGKLDGGWHSKPEGDNGCTDDGGCVDLVFGTPQLGARSSSSGSVRRDRGSLGAVLRLSEPGDGYAIHCELEIHDGGSRPWQVRNWENPRTNPASVVGPEDDLSGPDPNGFEIWSSQLPVIDGLWSHEAAPLPGLSWTGPRGSGVEHFLGKE